MANHEETGAEDHASPKVREMLKTVPHLATMSCSDLCAELNNDQDVLENLEDFPPNQRAKIRAAMLRDIRTVAAALKQQKCPPCLQ